MSKTLNTNMVILNGVAVIDPSELSWALQDVSASDAGRNEAVEMKKRLIGQIRKYDISWNMIDPENASIILKAINEKENFYCRLYDVMDGEYQERLYYVGDRSAPFKQWMDRTDGKVFSKVSFSLIEVKPNSNITE